MKKSRSGSRTPSKQGSLFQGLIDSFKPKPPEERKPLSVSLKEARSIRSSKKPSRRESKTPSLKPSRRKSKTSSQKPPKAKSWFGELIDTFKPKPELLAKAKSERLGRREYKTPSEAPSKLKRSSKEELSVKPKVQLVLPDKRTVQYINEEGLFIEAKPHDCEVFVPLGRCSKCDRSFFTNRLDIHHEICKETLGSKRFPFNAKHQRMRAIPPGFDASAWIEKLRVVYTKWREDSEELRRIIEEAKAQYRREVANRKKKAEKRSGDTDLQPDETILDKTSKRSSRISPSTTHKSRTQIPLSIKEPTKRFSQTKSSHSQDRFLPSHSMKTASETSKVRKWLNTAIPQSPSSVSSNSKSETTFKPRKSKSAMHSQTKSSLKPTARDRLHKRRLSMSTESGTHKVLNWLKSATSESSSKTFPISKILVIPEEPYPDESPRKSYKSKDQLREHKIRPPKSTASTTSKVRKWLESVTPAKSTPSSIAIPLKFSRSKKSKPKTRDTKKKLGLRKRTTKKLSLGLKSIIQHIKALFGGKPKIEKSSKKEKKKRWLRRLIDWFRLTNRQSQWKRIKKKPKSQKSRDPSHKSQKSKVRSEKQKSRRLGLFGFVTNSDQKKTLNVKNIMKPSKWLRSKEYSQQRKQRQQNKDKQRRDFLSELKKYVSSKQKGKSQEKASRGIPKTKKTIQKKRRKGISKWKKTKRRRKAKRQRSKDEITLLSGILEHKKQKVKPSEKRFGPSKWQETKEKY